MPRSIRLPPPDEVANDTPLRLDVAAAIAFPAGGMTASGLRREAARSRLAIMRIAGRDFTTLAAIAEMKAQCLVPRKEHASTSANVTGGTALGSSETERRKSALAAANAICAELRKPLPRTSASGTSQTSATIHRHPSSSRT